ncbi:hypothetical protein [Methanobacterium aggregans]|uniref:hypothetical protein n=1 Tax=Methanobacterium aggregans TaxID=1615586 RepID=UPI001AE642FE|nr:hypothetical protein [Methanobacterium aggregans]MBP2045320.1 energy-converting hydrogenase A subunit R [Methanobacterium aggregans]
MGKKFFVSDCEGPISTNDNAFELSGHFIEDGEKFFEIISRYDDVLVDVVKRDGYNAGGTLKLITPFLKAYGADNQTIIDFSAENVMLLKGAVETLKFVSSTMPSFIVSTSYEQYIEALCRRTGFPYENTYSTKLDMDRFNVDPDEAEKLREFRRTIVENPEFEVLDKIFWKNIPSMEIGGIMESVHPVGGEGKKEAIQDIIRRFNLKASDLFYIGDSITDVQPLRFANTNGGISVSFNGNEYALPEAEIAVIADNTAITSVLADVFNRYGTDTVLDFVVSYYKDPETALESGFINPKLAEKVLNNKLPQVEVVNCDNMDRLIDESTKFRKEVRGKAIGGLG